MSATFTYSTNAPHLHQPKKTKMPIIKPPLSLVLVTAPTCDVGCKTCPAGRKEEQPSGWMKTEMADRIITKAKKEARVLSVCMYYFNEPFLLPNIVDLVKVAHKHKLPILLSSNLVRFKNGLEVLALEPFNLIISVSGWTQEIYERSHAGGDIAKVKANMELISKHKLPGTSIRVSWHRYKYNEHEEPIMRAYAEKLGFTFTPYGTGLLPLERVEARWNGAPATYAEEDIMVPVLDAQKLCQPRKHWACSLQNQTICVDADGNILNCGTRNGVDNLRGSFFDRCVSTILKERQTDSMCVKCKAQGLHIYGEQRYTVPLKSKARWLIDTYKRLKLQGIIPGLTTAGVRRFYMRPQEDYKKELNK